MAERPYTLCTYCGDRATTLDHVVPYAFAGKLPPNARKGGSDAGKTVPACGDCNSWLGSRMFKTIAARKQAVADALPRRHAKLLATPIWTADELLEVSRSLRSLMFRTAEKRVEIERRIQWARHAPVQEPED